MFKYSFDFFKILFVQISDIGQHVVDVDTRPPLAVFQNGMINQTYKVKVFLVLLGHFFMTQLYSHSQWLFYKFVSKNYY